MMKNMKPSLDQWLAEAKAAPDAENCGMYLSHCGVVRRSAKAKVRLGKTDTKPVTGMRFSYDAKKLEQAVAAAKRMEDIFHVRVWLNEGELRPGDDIMLVLIGGDIRPHVVDALQTLVGTIKNDCVTEEELYE